MLTFKLHLFIKNFFFLFFILILFFFSIIPLLLILILLNFFLFLNSFWLNHKYSQFKTYFFIKFLTPETLTSQVINIFILSYCLTFNFICDWLVENPNNNFFFENLTIKSFFLNFFFFLFFFFSFEIPTISFIWFFNELKKNINLNFFNSTMELLKMFNNTINFSFDTEIFFFNNLKLNKKKNTFFFEVHMCAYYNYDKKIKILNHFIIFKNYKINCSLLLNSYLKKKTFLQFLFLNKSLIINYN